MIVQSNALSLAFVLFFVTLELSFTESTAFNFYVFIACLSYLIYQRRWSVVLACFIVPLLPAIATFWSVHLQGTRPELAIVLLTRTFAFASSGLVFAFGIDLEELLLTCEQKGLPPQFVYGILVVLHAFQELKDQVIQIRQASWLRGQKLGFWSPFYYLKVIFTAYSWQDSFHQALLVHGFNEDIRRKPSIIYRQNSRWILLLLFIVIAGQCCLVF